MIISHLSGSNVFKGLIVVSVLLVVGGFFVSTAQAATLNVVSDATKLDYRNVIVKAADRLVATQNNDGGWEWDNPNTNPAESSPFNTLGVTAQGILDAYQLTGNNSYLEASIKSYDGMVVRSGDPNPSTHRIRGPDISFLVELSEIAETSTYADFAKARWESAKTEFGSGTATGFAQFIRDGRISQGLPAIISWDVNLYVQGVLALDRYYPGEGYTAEANEIVEVIYDSLFVEPEDFDLTASSSSEYWLAYTGAIESFTSTNLHATERDTLVTDLLGSQAGDWHFIGVGDGSDVQTTAYAAIALLKASQNAVVSNAATYLRNSQQVNGSWIYSGSTENTEITSEAAQALFDYIYVVDTYYTIQDAINAASAGDTINVAAGTYSEPLASCGSNQASLCITKSLVLHGDPGDASAGPGASAPVLDGGNANGSAIAFSGTVSNVTIEGFKISNYANPGVTGGIGSGVLAWYADTSNITVQDNYLHDLGWNGVLVGSDELYTTPDNIQTGWTIRRNIVNDAAYAGIELTNVTNSEVAFNEITIGAGISWDPNDSGVGIEVAVRDHGTGVTAGTGVSVHDNEITGDDVQPERAGINLLARAYDFADADAHLSGVTVSGNTVSGATRGIFAVAETRNAGATAAVESLTVTGNTISGNETGIEVWDNTNTAGTPSHSGFTINGNSIAENTAGVIVVNGNVVDATNNWWGTVSSTEIAAKVNNSVLYEPYCAVADCSSIFTTITAEGSPLQDAQLSIPSGSSVTSTPSVTFLAASTIDVGTSTVILPEGVVVTKSGGGNIDATLLNASSTEPGSLSGLGTGVVVAGALQWGIPNLGLEFSEPITLKIYVGESLNGQILNIVRSISGTDGWTSDGINPTSCVVTNGLCEFTATKASYYAAGQFTVVTQPATDIRTNAATLNGMINIPSGGEPATARGFRYGSNTSYGSTVEETGSFAAGTFSRVIENLSCGTTYHYQAYAVNDSGTVSGADNSFTTLDCRGSGGGGGTPTIVSVTTPTPTPAPAPAPAPTPTPTPTPTPQVLGAATFSFTQTLKFGSEGNEVTELQKRLTAEGVYTGPITGYFGLLTEAGVKALQAKYGIEQAGIVGPLTRAKLNEGGQVLGATTAVDAVQLQAQLTALREQLNALLQKLVEAIQTQLNQQLQQLKSSQ